MHKPILIIKVNQPHVTLELKDAQGMVLDEKTWEEKNDMSRTLLDSIDKLLAKNKIEIEQLAKINVESKQARYTSSRISRAVAKTVNYCLGVDNK